MRTSAGSFDLSGAKPGKPRTVTALTADWLTVDQHFVSQGMPQRTRRGNSGKAKVGRFFDDPASWLLEVDLREFVYDLPASDQVNVQLRLDWLTRNADGYVPQMYEQLANAYRNAGREEAARRVAIAKQWRRRERTQSPQMALVCNCRLWVSHMAGRCLVGCAPRGRYVGVQPAHMSAIRTHPPAFTLVRLYRRGDLAGHRPRREERLAAARLGAVLVVGADRCGMGAPPPQCSQA